MRAGNTSARQRSFGMFTAIDRKLISLDELYYRARMRNANGRTRLFHRGWGNQADIDAVMQRWDAPGGPEPAGIQWRSHKPGPKGTTLRYGVFESAVYADRLTEESRFAEVLMVLPARDAVRSAVLIAPTSREIGFGWRMPTALDLAAQGVATVMVDNPYMGERKPHDQIGTSIRFFSDYPLLTATCVEENRQLLAWMRVHLSKHIVASGVSQGGFTSAAAAMRLGFAIGVICVATPHSGEPVLIDGIPGRICDWDELNRTCPGGVNARAEMKAVFERTRLDNMAIPTPAPYIKMLAAARDRYVPAASYETLANHWKGIAEVKWMPGGHVSTILEHRRYMHEVHSMALDAAHAEAA